MRVAAAASRATTASASDHARCSALRPTRSATRVGVKARARPALERELLELPGEPRPRARRRSRPASAPPRASSVSPSSAACAIAHFGRSHSLTAISALMSPPGVADRAVQRRRAP